MLKSFKWLLSLATIPTVSFAGGMDSGGGGLRGFESNPWFIGSREVSYCVEVNANFPDASTNGVRNTVKNAFDEWRRFQKIYRLDQRAFNLEFLDNRSRGIDLRYTEVANCNRADIKVLIGVVDDTVKKILKRYPPETYAFAHLTSDYDFKHYTRDNKGLIWIAQPEYYGGQLFPPYDKRPILPLVLLHEIGHTLGIGHLEKYSIMGGNIFEWMTVAEDDASIRNALKKFATIDNPTPLISFGRKTKWVPVDGKQHQVKPIFMELTGREAVGNIEFSLATTPGDEAEQFDQKGTITLRDEKGDYKIDLLFHVGSEIIWPYCKIKLSWKGVAPNEPSAIRTHGCIDPVSSDYLVGTVLDANGEPIQKSKITIGTRQKILTSFGGTVRDTSFNIHLKLVGAIE